MGRKWTKEQREAASQRAKEAIAKKAAEAEDQIPTQEPPVAPATASNVTEPASDPGTHSPEYDEILRRITELERDNIYWRNQAIGRPGAPSVGQQGLVGTFDKYKLEPAYYPDPRMRLAAEPRLQRFAFDFNYELEWSVSVSTYQTKDGINTREPKFTLQLNRIVMDEDTGEATNGRYKVCQMIFHEDPEAALAIARENGVDVADYEERAFLDEMRYLRMRDWLLEAFYPPKPNQQKNNKREVVINGRQVEFWEINSETPEAVPFNQLNKKL